MALISREDSRLFISQTLPKAVDGSEIKKIFPLFVQFYIIYQVLKPCK